MSGKRRLPAGIRRRGAVFTYTWRDHAGRQFSRKAGDTLDEAEAFKRRVDDQLAVGSFRPAASASTSPSCAAASRPPRSTGTWTPRPAQGEDAAQVTEGELELGELGPEVGEQQAGGGVAQVVEGEVLSPSLLLNQVPTRSRTLTEREPDRRRAEVSAVATVRHHGDRERIGRA